MSDKESFDSFYKLAEFRLKRFEMRQQFELRMSFALWTLILVATVTIQERPPGLVVALVLLVLFVIHALYVGQNWIRHENDQDTAFYYLEQAERILSPDASVRERPWQIQQFSAAELWFEFLREPHLNWNSTFQILTTFALAVLSFVFLGHVR